MNDLQTRITEYVDTTVPPLDIDLLAEQLSENEEPSRWLQPKRALPLSWRHRRWAAILAGAIVVLILIGGAGLLLDPAEPPVITTPDETTPAPTTSLPSPTTIPVPPLLVTPATGPWTTYELLGNNVIGDDLVVSSVVPGGPGFVAVGLTWRQSSGDVWSRGQIWTSTDGLSWTWVADEDHTLFNEGHWPEGILDSDTGLIVWGSNNRQGGTTMWHSDGGTDWSLISVKETPLESDYFTEGLPLASGGYLLYGTPANCSVESGTCSRPDLPRILVSSDGSTWELVTTPVTFTAIVQTESGNLLAAQRRASEPTTWISNDDGRSWQRHGPDNSIELGQRSAEVWTVRPTQYGLIAAGVDSEKRPALWISEDGKTFTPTFELAAHDTVRAIASGQGWVVAVGADDLGPAMWASNDGSEWLSVPLAGSYLGGGDLYDIAYRDFVFVAVGQHRAEIGGEALILRWAPDSG